MFEGWEKEERGWKELEEGERVDGEIERVCLTRTRRARRMLRRKGELEQESQTRGQVGPSFKLIN